MFKIKQGTPKKECVIFTRVAFGIHKQLKDMAKENHVTLSELVRQIVVYHLKDRQGDSK